MTQNDEILTDEGQTEELFTSEILSIPLPQWILKMSVAERTGLVMNIISQLPTSKVAKIVSLLRPRLYINFFEYLPQEVLLHILGLLDARSLLNTARSSREWMPLAMDPRLWKQLYLREGFKVVSKVVNQFEEIINSVSLISSKPDLSKSKINTRAHERHIYLAKEDGDLEMIDNNQLESRKTRVEYSETLINTDMAKPLSLSPIFASTSTPPRIESVETEKLNLFDSINPVSTIALSPSTYMSSLSFSENQGNHVKNKLNWHYLYSQRRRLESNWETEKYVNFQLPDPSHLEEAHSECIYTIHHTGKYLVSGGRDKTIRIWNLDTRRLIRPPLRAHSGSVLCLQFDADPEEDLIVSGSSDCSIIVWRFSTGQVIQKIPKAHKQPILNVQFDKRIIVTCSKDKTIKIFNRKPLHEGDGGNLLDIANINPVPVFMNYGLEPRPSIGSLVKPAYSLIGILDGHSAAVNALQIQGDEVVSASGDRLVKIWNWPKQICVRTLVGHGKGIACVYYDGRRIVSGGSDNEIKVFDKETAVEVASLRAHTHIVRTIQADFGDLPFSFETDKEDAKAVDFEYFKAVESGALSTNLQLEHGRNRNAGSRRPEHITAFGATIPPGGGGGKFGRIVSGSYDETIIIWRRDKEGIWKPKHIFRHEDAAQAAARNFYAQPETKSSIHEQQFSRLKTRTSQAYEPNSASNQNISNSTATSPRESNAFYCGLIDNAVAQGPSALRSTLVTHPQLLNYETYLRNRINVYPHDLQQGMENIIASAFQVNRYIAQPHTSIYRQPALPAISHNLHQAYGETPAILANTNSIAPEALPPTTTTDHNSTLRPTPDRSQTMLNTAVHHGNLPNRHNTNNMSRVFKLQFDARRIICCSQTNIIVGWDFANNDKKLIEASRFFAGNE